MAITRHILKEPRVREFPEKIEDMEKLIEGRAAYFTAALFLGSGKYDRREFPTREAAIKFAKKAGPSKSGKRWCIYAVDPQGRSAHLGTI